MKEIINVEFNKRELGHATFQVQKRVEEMIMLFESNVNNKLEILSSTKNNNDMNPTSDSESIPTRNHTGDKWYHWDGKYRRVPYDWEFSKKMTLCITWNQMFLEDHNTKFVYLSI